MVNQQLLDYIKQQLQQNISKEQIRNSLIANGWQASDVEEGFNSIVVGIQNNLTFPVPKTSNSLGKIITSLLAIVVLAVLSWFTYGYFYSSKINKQEEVPLVNQETNQTLPQTLSETPPTPMSPQNNSALADCGTVNWDTFLKVGGLAKKPLTDSEKIALACTDKVSLSCSPAILKVDNNGIGETAIAFYSNNYKILGLDGNFCKISAELFDVKIQKIRTGICKIPMSDVSKFSQLMPNFSLMIFTSVGSSVIQGKPEQKGWECSFNQL